MKEELVQQFIIRNGKCFKPEHLSEITKTLEVIDDSKAPIILALDFRDPTNMLIIAILLGWERFFLDDIGLGILKVLTCFGCYLWWIIDIFTVQNRTFEYNYRKFNQAIMS